MQIESEWCAINQQRCFTNHSIRLFISSEFSQGNNATSGFCSKCWRDMQKTKSAVAAAMVAPPSPETMCTKVVEKAVPLAVDVNGASMTDAYANAESSKKTPKSAAATPEIAITETPAVTESATAAVANAPAKKKKKKKTSYKNMMASMMKETSKDKDSANDDAIRKVTGGGAFSKIEKI